MGCSMLRKYFAFPGDRWLSDIEYGELYDEASAEVRRFVLGVGEQTRSRKSDSAERGGELQYVDMSEASTIGRLLAACPEAPNLEVVLAEGATLPFNPHAPAHVAS